MFLVGQPVQITPKSPAAKQFWQYVDGWTGTVGGINNGVIVVNCIREDGIKTFFVEPDNLTALHNFGRALG